MEKKTKHFLLTSGISLIILSLIVLLCLGIVMDRKSEATISSVSRIYMEEMNNQLQKKFEAIIDLQLSRVDAVVARIEEEVLTDEIELRDELVLCAKIRSFDFLGLYSKDSTIDTVYGPSIELSDYNEFQEIMNHENIWISSGVSSDGQKLFLLAVDAAYPMADGKTSDALVAGVSMESLADSLDLDEEENMLFSHVITEDGSFIIRSGDAYRDNYFDRINSVFEEHNGKTPEQYEQELRSAMKAQRPYDTCAVIDGVHQYIYCTVINHSKWYLLSAMPYGTLDQAVTELGTQRQYMMLLSGGIILLGILIVFILYYRMSQKQLMELSRAQQETARANQAKSEFLSNMSHDIRTPLNGIVGMTAIAQSNIQDPDRIANCLSKIALSSKHLLGLINDVLDMSKIESGKLSLNTQIISLKETMSSMINIVQSQVKAKKQHFDIFIQNIQFENVYCDSVRLNQVLLNLLSNALKFTPEDGTIHVYLEQENSPLGEDYVRCHFRVKDTGIGMTPEFQCDIFEKFSRERTQQVNKTEGTGLGMAITKAIVDVMKGTIELKSAPGAGTEFHIILDLEKAVVKEADMVLPPWKMLVVDDDKDLCLSAVNSLKDIGVNAEWALNGETAISMAAQHHADGDGYQIILLDWKMEGMCGIETARQLRRHLGDDVPILIISAYDWSDIENEAEAAGIQGFIPKPLFKSNLYTGLSPYMLKAQTAAPELKEASSLFSGKRILLAEDNDLNWEIAEDILSDAGFKLERAENGQICVDKFTRSEIGFYDLILMDIRMPIMNGYEATSSIRALGRSDSHLPIIAMTADAFSDDIQHSLECGMNEHIAKPIDVDQLIQILKQYLK